MNSDEYELLYNAVRDWEESAAHADRHCDSAGDFDDDGIDDQELCNAVDPFEAAAYGNDDDDDNNNGAISQNG